MTSRPILLALLVAGLCAAVAGPAVARTVAFNPRQALTKAVLTQDGVGTYTVVNRDGTATVTAPTTVGVNQRETFWRAAQLPVFNADVCATWTNPAADHQEGLALRIVPGSTSTRAVIVTKNVVFGLKWMFNLAAWDSSADPAWGNRFGQFDMAHVVVRPDGQLYPQPWRVCARTEGDRMSFKVWVPGLHPEPAWSDQNHVRSATIPTGWNVPGRTGWYTGHIPPGGSMSYTEMR